MRWEKATIEQNETGQGERIFTRHKPVKTDEDDESTLLRPIISMIAHTQTHKLKAKQAAIQSAIMQVCTTDFCPDSV